MALGFVVAGPVIVVATTMVSCVAPVPGSGAGKIVGAGLAGKSFFDGAFTTKRILPLLMDASTAVASQKTS